jgi:hypothetical protein
MMNMTEQQYGKDRIQVRCEFDTNRIHVQGIGKTQVNRKYGLALELQAPPKLTDWLLQQEPTVVSPASGNLLYVEAELRHYFEDGDKTRLVVLGEELNHPEGAALNMDMTDLQGLLSGEDFAPVGDYNPAIHVLLDFAKNSGLLVLTAGEAYTIEEETE